jgi:hypothetical protein
MKNYIFHVYYYYKTQIVQRDQFKTNQSTVNIIQEVLAERLGVLSLLTRSRVQPLSLSAAGLLESPCHPGRGLVWAKPGIPWFTKKKKKSMVNIILSSNSNKYGH